MAMRYLGDRFDIHTGGIDNVFPHHEDEIAQSAPLIGGPPANLWVHGEYLLMSGRKMAKSAGNFQRVTELADRGIDPLALRYLAMTSRYSHKLEYSDASIARGSVRADVAPVAAARPRARAARRSVGRPGAAGGGCRRRPAAGRRRRPGAVMAMADRRALTDRAHAPAAPLSAAGLALHHRFVDAIDDDLDLPTALAVVRETLRPTCPADERRWLVLDADAVLGPRPRTRSGTPRADGRRPRGPGRRHRARRRSNGGPSGQGLRPGRCAPGEIEAAGMDGDRQRRRSDGQAGRVSRSRRAPNRSMIR